MLLEEETRADSNPGKLSKRKGEDVDCEDDDLALDATDATDQDRPLLLAVCVRALREISEISAGAGVPMVLRFLLEGALSSRYNI